MGWTYGSGHKVWRSLCYVWAHAKSHGSRSTKNLTDRVMWPVDVSLRPGLPQCVSNGLLNGAIVKAGIETMHGPKSIDFLSPRRFGDSCCWKSALLAQWNWAPAVTRSALVASLLYRAPPILDRAATNAPWDWSIFWIWIGLFGT